MRNIAITTECVADFPLSLVNQKDVDIIYFDVRTEEGIFRDMDEIDATNITEYMDGGKHMATSVIPSAGDYKNFFKRKLEEYDEVIHISIGSRITPSVESAKLGRAKLGIDHYKVHIIDSHHVSSGITLLVMDAIKCRDEGMSGAEIVKHVENMIPRVKTSFICNNADYLYYNNRVPKIVMQFSRMFHAHLIMEVENGYLQLDQIYFGDFQRAGELYIKKRLRKDKRIDKSNGFFTYVGCEYEMREDIKNQINKRVHFETLWEQQASAAVSSNCGPLTFGIIYAVEDETE